MKKDAKLIFITVVLLFSLAANAFQFVSIRAMEKENLYITYDSIVKGQIISDLQDDLKTEKNKTALSKKTGIPKSELFTEDDQ